MNKEYFNKLKYISLENKCTIDVDNETGLLKVIGENTSKCLIDLMYNYMLINTLYTFNIINIAF